jgi:hypothetical protein
MADIFVSYATEDRERAPSVAQALEERLPGRHSTTLPA